MKGVNHEAILELYETKQKPTGRTNEQHNKTNKGNPIVCERTGSVPPTLWVLSSQQRHIEARA